jgi:predicted transcriptional regulator of viral defense system
VFTTHDLSSVSGKSPSAVTQSLNNLVREKIVLKVCRGVWAEAANPALSQYAAIPFLFPRHRAYVSFISALNLYGIIGQIPQVVTLASTTHAKTVRSGMGTFQVHHIAPSFFTGFGWYKDNGSFLIAEPEKALVDCLYLSAYKGNRFGNFPELDLPRSFSFKKAREWAKHISSRKVRVYVTKKLEGVLKKG